MKRIGITGPTGAGKTTALDALKELGACVIDADAVYHDLLQSSAPLRSALTDRFGGEILDKAGKLDRKRMGNVVFQDPAALAELNGITHGVRPPSVRAQAAPPGAGRPGGLRLLRQPRRSRLQRGCYASTIWKPAALFRRFATARPMPASSGHMAQMCSTSVSSK